MIQDFIIFADDYGQVREILTSSKGTHAIRSPHEYQFVANVNGGRRYSERGIVKNAIAYQCHCDFCCR